eukprot:scaffold4328_cov135-Isochrysis_galbana.AAC.12
MRAPLCPQSPSTDSICAASRHEHRCSGGAMGEVGPCPCPSEKGGGGVGASSAVRDGVFSASGGNDEVVGGGVCSFEQMVSEARVDSRTGCAATLWLLTERSPGVYRLRTPTRKGGVMCKALAGSGRLSEQTICSPNLDLQHRWVKRRGSLAHLVVLCAGSRGRFGDEAISMTMSFGAEAEGAERASAGNCSMPNQK